MPLFSKLKNGKLSIIFEIPNPKIEIFGIFGILKIEIFGIIKFKVIKFNFSFIQKGN